MKNATDVKRNTGADLKAMAEAKFAGRQAAQRPKTPREQLDEYKAMVRRGLRGFVEIGSALGTIAKFKLFREDGYDSFEEFVSGEFEMSKAAAYRAIEAARVIIQLSQVETIASTITNQAQALELAPLVKSVAAMMSVVEAARARGTVTAESLKAVRIELFPNPKVIDGELVKDRAAIEAPKSTVVEAMRQAIEDASRSNDSGDAVGKGSVSGQTAVGEGQSGSPSADGGEGGSTASDDPPAGDGSADNGSVSGNPKTEGSDTGVALPERPGEPAATSSPLSGPSPSPPADSELDKDVELVASQPGSQSSPVAPGGAGVSSFFASAAPETDSSGNAVSGAQNFTGEEALTPAVQPLQSPSERVGQLDGDREEEPDSGHQGSSSTTFMDAIDGLWVALDRLDYDATGPQLLDEDLTRIEELPLVLDNAAKLLRLARGA